MDTRSTNARARWLLGALLVACAAWVHPPDAPARARPYDPPRGPGDALPEPRPPQDECDFEPRTHCVAPSPVTAPWQPAPFEACPRELALPAERSRGEGDTARFSPRETRSAWRSGRRACCYVQFVRTDCD